MERFVVVVSRGIVVLPTAKFDPRARPFDWLVNAAVPPWIFLIGAPASAPGLVGSFALTALLLAAVAPTPQWTNRRDRIPLPLVCGPLLA
jgi:hypothetical protein